MMKYNEIKNSAQELADIMVNKFSDNGTSSLEKWLKDNPTSKEVIDVLANEGRLSKELDDYYRKDKFYQARKLQKSIKRVKNRERVIRYSVSVAAAILALSFIVWHSGERNITSDYRQLYVDNNQYVDIEREYKFPTLISYNGEELQLDATNKDKIIMPVSLDLSKLQPSTKNQTLYNTIVVPRASDYTFTLVDGTIVKLNAGSRLEYPVEFNDSCRQVKLEGEGYFEVKKDSRQFVVNVGEMQVKVYGTKFNVNAYDQNSIKTFLLEGSVGIKTIKDCQEIILQPNYLSITSQSGESVIFQDDAAKYLAWVNGRFEFEEYYLKDVLTELERWYDVDFNINCKPELLDKKVVASFSRDINISRVLTMLNKVYGLNFTQKERRINIE